MSPACRVLIRANWETEMGWLGQRSLLIGQPFTLKIDWYLHLLIEPTQVTIAPTWMISVSFHPFEINP
jgi:hypothetical protein